MKHAVLKIWIFLGLLITTASIATPTYWREFSPGLDYTKIKILSNFQLGTIHAFRIDLDHYNLELALADSIASVRDLTLAHNALIGINGGFFSQELKPLGLRINQSQIKNPIKATRWWGVFYTQNQKPYIVAQQNFNYNKKINFAIQSGPRLVVNNHIPRLKNGVDNRSALGITKSGKVILLATENLNLSTHELASIMRKSELEGGLDCKEAINLDGGSSTQLYANINLFKVNVDGINAVTDAILVVPKKSITAHSSV